MEVLGGVFFFSKGRRHTKSPLDLSSDLISSDLAMEWFDLQGECILGGLPPPPTSRLHRGTSPPPDGRRPRGCYGWSQSRVSKHFIVGTMECFDMQGECILGGLPPPPTSRLHPGTSLPPHGRPPRGCYGRRPPRVLKHFLSGTMQCSAMVRKH